MSVMVGNVSTFVNAKPNKKQAKKILEEAAEVFAAWQAVDIDDNSRTRDKLFSECADLIQATCNLLAAFGMIDFRFYMSACRATNELRGREMDNNSHGWDYCETCEEVQRLSKDLESSRNIIGQMCDAAHDLTRIADQYGVSND